MELRASTVAQRKSTLAPLNQEVKNIVDEIFDQAVEINSILGEFKIVPEQPNSSRNSVSIDWFDESLQLNMDGENENAVNGNGNGLGFDRAAMAAAFASGSGLAIGEYSGNTPIGEFIEKFERIASCLGLPAELKLRLLPISLQNAAKHAYNNFERQFLKIPADYSEENWENLKRALKKAFSKSGTRDLLRMQLRKRSQGPMEHVENYYFSMLDLINRCFPEADEGETIKLIVDGLLPIYKGPIILMELDSLPVLLDKLKLLEYARMASGDQVTNLFMGNGSKDVFQNFLSDTIGTGEMGGQKRSETKNEAINTASIQSMLEKFSDVMSKTLNKIERLERNFNENRNFRNNNFSNRNFQNGNNFNRNNSNFGQNRNNNYQYNNRGNWRSDSTGQGGRFGNSRGFNSQPNTRTPDGTPICQFCHRVGHTTAACRIRNEQPNRNAGNSNTSSRGNSGNNRSNQESWANSGNGNRNDRSGNAPRGSS